MKFLRSPLHNLYSMKTIRWVFFLPGAIIGSLFFSFIFNWVGHMMIPNWKILKFISVTVWFGTGVLSAAGWMAIGYKIAPVTNKIVKWILLIPLLLLMGAALYASIFIGSTVTHIPASSINGKTGQVILCATAFITAIIFIFEKPKEF